MGRGNSLIYGKVAVQSETATMDDLVKTLDKVIAKHGYPEERKMPTIEELEEGDEDEVPTVDEDVEETDEGMEWKVK